MELTSRAEYALMALMELADRYAQGKAIKMNEIIAKHPNIPERYLEQILLMLRREGIIQSQRGARGGYILAREPRQISLLEILTIVNGKPDSKGAEPSKPISIEQSSIHHLWLQGCQAMQSVLNSHTLQDLCQSRERYRQSDPMYYI